MIYTRHRLPAGASMKTDPPEGAPTVYAFSKILGTSSSRPNVFFGRSRPKAPARKGPEAPAIFGASARRSRGVQSQPCIRFRFWFLGFPYRRWHVTFCRILWRRGRFRYRSYINDITPAIISSRGSSTRFAFVECGLRSVFPLPWRSVAVFFWFCRVSVF